LRLPERAFAYGFSLNKRRILRRFASESVVHAIGRSDRVPPHSTVLLWGSRSVPPAVTADVQVVRVEDGFLRSVGLGAELVSPLSWVMDGRGIHYDATRVSDLEHLLQTTDFDAELLARAARLRQRIASAGITKYNVGRGFWSRPFTPARVILVPGQVEADASLRLGAPAIRTNMGLLQAVREANPRAYLVYKPHPDVVAGIRARGAAEREALRWCNEVEPDAPMGGLLKEVDEVHVLTSLAGFEALLRDKQVVCYGLPFYAGWGLTRDVLSEPRRQRRLSLDELVAGALILYPRYVSRISGDSISAEQALDELLQWREGATAGVRLWQYAWRALLRLTVVAK
jgi:capsular polysaccharide export protein